MDKYLNRNVLVADDDKAARRLLVKVLESLEVENVVEAVDGDDALKAFWKEKFDLILLDWGMPGKSGLEVLEAIRADPCDAPVIMVTAHSERKHVVEAAEAGVSDFLVKPLDLVVLKKKLTPYCKRKVNTSICRCRNVMISNVVTVNADATCLDAIGLLLQHNISGLPVVDDESRLVGIVTEYKLMEAIASPDLKSESVRNVMTKNLITVNEDTIPLRAVSLMRKHRIRRVPVVRENELVGLIARRDLLRYAIDYEEVLRGFLEEIRVLHGELIEAS